MSVDTFIERMRTRQADLFSDTVQITAAGAGPGTRDPATARTTRPAPTTVYDGPGLIRPENDSTVIVGGTSEQETRFLLKVPVDTPVVIGHDVQVTESVYDTALVGLVFRVIEVQPDEWQISRRVVCVSREVRPA